MGIDYEQDLKEKYPLNKIENEFSKIEKLGYSVYPREDQCTIYLREKLIIDADFCNDWHSNAADAIDAFYNGG